MKKFYNKKNSIDEIKSMINNLMNLYDIEFKKIKLQVDYIINNNITDMVYIEQILEQLLNIPYEPSYQLFIELCDYISKFNKEIADEYLEIFKKLYDDIPKTKKKKKNEDLK